MDLPISKTQMKLAIKLLERMAAELNDVPVFRRIIVTTEHFDAEHLVMLCTVYANEMEKYQQKYFEALDSSFPNYISGGCATEDLILKLRIAHKMTEWKKPLQPPIWRRIWNKLKKA